MAIHKLLSILFCIVCLLSAAPIWAQNTEIEAAKKVVDDFYNLQKQGQNEAALELMVEPLRSITITEWEKIAPIRDFFEAVKQKSEHKIIATKMVGNEIHVKIEITTPDTLIASAKAEKDIPPNLSQDERSRAWVTNAAKIVLTEKLPTMVQKTTLMLAKENGIWKIVRIQY